MVAIGVKLDIHGSEIRKEANGWVTKQEKHWERFSELAVMIQG